MENQLVCCDDDVLSTEVIDAEEQLIAKARRALAKLDKHAENAIPLMLEFGKVLFDAKDTVKHGQFGKWCVQHLGRKPSWCADHRRLYEWRADIQPALNWAVKTGHRYAHCRSIEKLRRIIEDWRRENGAAQTRNKLRGTAAAIARLRQAVDTAEELKALRDAMPSRLQERVLAMAVTNFAEKATSGKDYSQAAISYFTRLMEFVDAQTCGTQQISNSSVEQNLGGDDEI
jgi:hypothetical protein